MIRACDYGDIRYFQMAWTVFGRAMYWTGVYVVDGLLVDSGPPNLAPEVRRLVGELGIRQCVTTHHHEDHAGNHALLSEQLHITPLVHSAGLARLAHPDPRPLLYRRLAWGVAEAAPATAVGQWLETPHFRFHVIHTPGHAPDHIVLYEPDHGWLFSGDLYLLLASCALSHSHPGSSRSSLRRCAPRSRVTMRASSMLVTPSSGVTRGKASSNLSARSGSFQNSRIAASSASGSR